jgi:tryptophanyl-tRNA synthetase
LQEIEKKVTKAQTDSIREIYWDPEERRGVGGLVRILGGIERVTDQHKKAASGTPKSDLRGSEWEQDPDVLHRAICARYESSSTPHSDLKKDVIQAVESLLAGPREEYFRLVGSGSQEDGEWGYLDEVARNGARRAREISSGVLKDVRRKVGLS